MNIIRGLLLSSKGHLFGQECKKKTQKNLENNYRFYIEEELEKVDLIQFCQEKIKTISGISWVNFRPKIIRKKRKKFTSRSSSKTIYKDSSSLLLIENQDFLLEYPKKKESIFSEKVLSFQENIYKEEENFEINFEREKIRFNTLSNKQLIKINEEFQQQNQKKKNTRSKVLPRNLIEILNKEVLCFWFLGSGQFKYGKFFFNLGNQSNKEKNSIINTLNAKFNFKISLLSNIKDIPGQQIYAHQSINNLFYSPTKSYNIQNLKNQAIIYEGTSEFFDIIKDIYFDLKRQELLFPKKIQNQAQLPFQQASAFFRKIKDKPQLVFEFANEQDYKEIQFNSKLQKKLLKERGDNFEKKQSIYSFYDLNIAALRKAKLINNYYYLSDQK